MLHGDNKDVLASLLANGFRGQVNLIYIDPPFDSGADYVRRISLRGANGVRMSGEDYTFGEQIQYSDIWANDNYLQFMYERLLLLRQLLHQSGSIWLHCDWHRSHQLRCVMDEVFGSDRFMNEIVWQRTFARAAARTINNIHDTLHVYGNGENTVWNEILAEASAEYLETRFTMIDAKTGGKFQGVVLTAPGLSKGETGQPWRGFNPSAQGRHWAHNLAERERMDAEGLIYWPPNGGWPRQKRFANDVKGVALQSIWGDVAPVNSQAMEDTGFPTQKPESLLQRVIMCASRPGDLVLDCFSGSGGTAVAAQSLGRRWIGCDINKGAIQTTVKRLRGVLAEQISEARTRSADARQGKLIQMSEDGAEPPPKPCAFGFTVWRVNDYDLAIQHNEAVNLACEHIGIERSRTDSYFDGTLGKKLAKVIPFGHPLTPLDLEELRRELESRPDEDRNITVVCLGMELAARTWVDDWNRLRTGRDTVNKIDVIELRTDPKYGRFIKHEPASARVKVSRAKRGEEIRIVVQIQDFISPTIVERLREQAGLLQPKIEDWRAMVDCIYIDTAYDGSVFNVALPDTEAIRYISTRPHRTPRPALAD